MCGWISKGLDYFGTLRNASYSSPTALSYAQECFFFPLGTELSAGYPLNSHDFLGSVLKGGIKSELLNG